MTPFERACLQGGRTPISIAKQFGVPLDMVLTWKHEHRVRRERAYKARRREAERALRIPKEEAPYFRDQLETDRANIDGKALAKWVSLPLLYGNHPDSVRGLDGSRYIPNLLKLPLRYARSECGISAIYEQLGTDMRAAA
jgi:hypothetical protein